MGFVYWHESVGIICGPPSLLKWFFPLIVARIGLELNESVFDEGVGAFEVCVVVTEPDLPCPIVFPFEMNFFTRPGTASRLI